MGDMRSRSSRVTVAVLILVILGAFTVAQSQGTSFYTQRLDDPQAVYLTPDRFPVKADGIADDADALQQAIDAVQAKVRYGIVFIPEGRYRLGKTVYVWKGIRLIGYGAKRPVFTLGANTPGFQGEESKYLFHFASDKPREGGPFRDANPGTFYSALSNVNFEIGDGNPAAVAVRSFFAQHCFLAHIDFHIGSGKAAVEQVGNEIDDCRFFGGTYGLLTTKPSPSWPFLLIDSYFEGQRAAAIRSEEGGLTIVRVQFKGVPSVIVVNPDRAEELFMTDSRMEDVTGPAIVISDEYNARPQFNLDNVVCANVPVLASFRVSGKVVKGPAPIYRVKDFTHGNQIGDLGQRPEVKTTVTFEALAQLPALPPTDVPDLPARDTWVNLAALGAKGDGVTDDTAALKAAIANHRTIYLPSGRYRVTDTITLRPDTVLIGLNPTSAQIILLDGTPGFDGDGAPKPLLEAPKGGANIVTGIGLDTAGTNPRAVAAKWMAGAKSLMNDVRFIGGHGTYRADGSGVPYYNESRTGDGTPGRKWDSQYWSLWVTDGGGGTFKDIWTPSPYAQAGAYISNTDTPGRIYAMSSEHHVRNEVRLRNVANWKLYDLQMEEESAEGPHALPLELIGCRNITIANLYLYRVWMVVSFPYGVKMSDCHDIDFRGVHVYSPGKLSYDATIYDQTHDFQVRSREIARLKVSGKPPVAPPATVSPVLAPGARVEKVVGGFDYIDGSTVDPTGNIYFTDARWRRIYRWSPAEAKLALVRDTPFAPMGLACDTAGNLLVVGNKGGSRRGALFAFNPARSEDDIQALVAVPSEPRPGQVAILPGHLWRDEHTILQVTSQPKPRCFVTPDGKTIIPEQEDLFRAWTLRAAVPGQTCYIADEFGQKTWAFTTNPDGSLVNPRLFAEEGELDVAVDTRGNVYVAAGDIFVYDKDGKQIDRILVPERPATLVFGGADRKTLFITARTSLYQVRIR